MIETERLVLRPWQEADAEVLFKYASDSDMGSSATWMPHILMEHSLEIIRTVFCRSRKPQLPLLLISQNCSLL